MEKINNDEGARRVVAPRRNPESCLLRWGDTRWARSHIETLAAALGTFQQAGPVLTAVLTGCPLSDEVQQAMTKRQPRGLRENPELDAFVRDACYLAAPATAYTAELLITIAGPYILWCVKEQGWPLQADVVFSRQAIDLYCTQENRGKSEGTRRNYRAMLMRISEVVAPDEHADTLTPLSRKRIATPYTAEEMEQFRFWALGQADALKRHRAMLMMVLCAGAGLRPTDVSQVFAADVTVDQAGVLIRVAGASPRMVPLLRDWEEWMSVLLEDASTQTPLWGKPNRTDGTNLLSSFTAYTAGNPPRSDRLRATWIVTHLQAGTRMKEFLRAAGFDKFENLPRYLEYVNGLDDESFRASLRGKGEK